jgi:spore maturation protein CgeB
LLPDGEAILIARNTQDVTWALTQIQDASRRSLGEAGHRVVLSSHTGLARARELAAAIERLPQKTSLQPQSRRQQMSA